MNNDGRLDARLIKHLDKVAGVGLDFDIKNHNFFTSANLIPIEPSIGGETNLYELLKKLNHGGGSGDFVEKWETWDSDFRTTGSLTINNTPNQKGDVLTIDENGLVSRRSLSQLSDDLNILIGGVPTSRELTINGVTFDLSQDRIWNVGTITSITAGVGLSGGTITTSGTIDVNFGTTIGTVAQGNDSRFHDEVTIGTANGLSLIGQELSLALATTTTSGAMSTFDKDKLDNLDADDVSETLDKEWLSEPIIINESDPNIGTIKFDTLKGYQHGTVSVPTNETIFSLDLTDAKRGSMFIIHSNAPSEPEIIGAEYIGGEYTPNQLNAIYGVFLGGNIVKYYYDVQDILDADDVSETLDKEWLSEPIIINEYDPNIGTIKFDTLKGYQHGTVSAPTDQTIFTLDLANAKRGSFFIIHSNAPSEPEITDGEYIGGEYIENGLNTIYGVFLGDGLVKYYYDTQDDTLNIVSLGDVSGNVTINIEDGNTFMANLIGSVTLSFNNVPTGGAGIILEFTGIEQITWPNGANAVDGIIPEATGGRYKYILTVRSANDYDVDGIIDKIEAVV